MENHRRRGQRFAFFLLVIIVALFAAILGAITLRQPSPEVTTALVGWGGTLIGALGTAISYEWGSSKGSAMKDELMAAPRPDSTTAQTATITTSTTNTEGPKP